MESTWKRFHSRDCFIWFSSRVTDRVSERKHFMDGSSVNAMKYCQEIMRKSCLCRTPHGVQVIGSPNVMRDQQLAHESHSKELKWQTLFYSIHSLTSIWILFSFVCWWMTTRMWSLSREIIKSYIVEWMRSSVMLTFSPKFLQKSRDLRTRSLTIADQTVVWSCSMVELIAIPSLLKTMTPITPLWWEMRLIISSISRDCWDKICSI